MSDVGKVTIETVVRDSDTVHSISATVNVGGSLVEVRLDSEQDPDLRALVDEINAKLMSLAVQAVQESLRSEAG